MTNGAVVVSWTLLCDNLPPSPPARSPETSVITFPHLSAPTSSHTSPQQQFRYLPLQQNKESKKEKASSATKQGAFVVHRGDFNGWWGRGTVSRRLRRRVWRVGSVSCEAPTTRGLFITVGSMISKRREVVWTSQLLMAIEHPSPTDDAPSGFGHTAAQQLICCPWREGQGGAGKKKYIFICFMFSLNHDGPLSFFFSFFAHFSSLIKLNMQSTFLKVKIIKPH